MRPPRRHRPLPYAVVDVETTSTDARKARIVEIAIIRLHPDGSDDHVYSTIVDSGTGPGPTHIHGLIAADLAGAPSFAEIAGDVAAMLDGAVIVAHNARHDTEVLSAESRVARIFSRSRRSCARLRGGRPCATCQHGSTAGYPGGLVINPVINLHCKGVDLEFKIIYNGLKTYPLKRCTKRDVSARRCATFTEPRVTFTAFCAALTESAPPTVPSRWT
ncbi:exonuclease domain-containing protein [Streptosporangium sp. NPDC087985]|uniref:exonuclease domain-containing protein n=1 Tax=Streptosporangium sp. NPDC087985 TaxID=3366196 RepID=UPI0038159BE0